MQLTLNIDRHYWDRHHRIAQKDIEMTRDIILELFDPLVEKYEGTYVIPLVATIEYASFVAARSVFMHSEMYHEPFAVERVIDHACDAVRLVMNDFWDEFQEKTHRLDTCAKRIQRTWKEAVSNPSFQVCQNRLMYEFCANRVLIPG